MVTLHLQLVILRLLFCLPQSPAVRPRPASLTVSSVFSSKQLQWRQRFIKISWQSLTNIMSLLTHQISDVTFNGVISSCWSAPSIQQSAPQTFLFTYICTAYTALYWQSPATVKPNYLRTRRHLIYITEWHIEKSQSFIPTIRLSFVYCVSRLCLVFQNIRIIQHDYPSNRNHPTISRITDADKDVPAACNLGNVFIFISSHQMITGCSNKSPEILTLDPSNTGSPTDIDSPQGKQSVWPSTSPSSESKHTMADN